MSIILDGLVVEVEEFNREVEEIVNEENVLKYLELFKTLKDFKENLDGLNKKCKAVFEKMNSEVLPAKYKEDGVTSMTYQGYRYTVNVRTLARILPEHRLEAYQWLRDNDLGDIIIETVNASTLSSAARELMEEGSELESDYFETYLKDGMSVTKAGK